MEKKEFIKLVQEDCLANNFKRKRPIPFMNYIQQYLYTLRRLEYFSHKSKGIGVYQIIVLLYKFRLKQLSVKLGITIEPNCFGGGLTLYHWGSIVVNGTCRGGKFCTIQSDVNISENVILGNNVYIAPGAKILANVKIADGVIIGANAVVTKDILEPYTTWVGVPATKISNKGYINRIDNFMQTL